MNKLTRARFDKIMHEAAECKTLLTGVIVYSQDNWPSKAYTLESRSYRVSNTSKYYQPDMCGSSLFGSALDGSDNGVRLDWYNWKVDYCYFE